jgi:hypothetical protein
MAQDVIVEPMLRRGAVMSLVLHVAILAAMLIAIPQAPPPEVPEEASFSMEFGPPQPARRAQTPAAVPAPPAPAPSPEPQAVEPPKPAPPSVAPPPPPPPPPPAPSPSVPTPPTPTPQTPPAQVTPEPTPTPIPPPPPAPPSPPQVQTPPLPTPPLPVPPPPVPSTTVSPNSQPNQTKNPAPDSHALDNTLEKLRAMVQKQPPTARYNPQQGGAPNGGGNPNGSDTSALSADARRAIGDQVRQCWTRDAGAPDADKLRVRMQVITDPQGVARNVIFPPEEQSRMAGDPVFRAFAERARRAILDARCANLPLPQSMLGQSRQLDFRFSP